MEGTVLDINVLTHPIVYQHRHWFHILSWIRKLLDVHRYLNLVGWFMVFYATFNNISVISWWPVLLMEETGVPGENCQPVASH